MKASTIAKAVACVVMAGFISACQGGKTSTSASAASAPVATKVAVDFNPKLIKQTVNPEEVMIYDGGAGKPMSYLIPQMRTAARALGFGGMAQYAVLRGPRATMRLATKQPVFLFAIPTNAQPESYFNIASFVVRENNTREVIVGGGYMSYSTGIHQDRLVPTSIERVSDQSKAPKGFVLYAATVNAPLSAGEYALVFYSSQIRSAGFFAHANDSYFDFGVD